MQDTGYKMQDVRWKTRDAFAICVNLRNLWMSLGPICSNHIVLAHHSCHTQVEYFKEFFKFLKDLSKKDGANPAKAGHKYSILNIQ